MLYEIIAELGENYKSSDEALIEQIIDETTSNALFISNRKDTALNRELLKPEIKQSVISQYLRRGTEDVSSLSQSGLNSNYIDYVDQLRKNIVKNGKRLIA